MSHLSTRNSYTSLVERLNRFPQGAPPSEQLYKILALLFTEQEARLMGQVPLLPFTAAKAARIWGRREFDAARLLEGLADRALLLDVLHQDEKFYVLPPPMTGFFEFSLMRARPDLDQEKFSELLFQYLNLEDAFIRELFAEGETRVGRVFVGEGEIPSADVTQVLDYERASEVIKSAWKIGVGTCSCRHKMKHLDRACSNDMELCMVFNLTADALIRHGQARQIDKIECLDLLQKAREQNLVQFGENVRDGVNFICNCCSCCCDSLIAARKLGGMQPIQTTNYLAEIKESNCSGCGRCVDACPVEALSLLSAYAPQRPGKRRSVILQERCLGCGVCVRVCQSGALSLVPRETRVVTPLDSAHRVVLMALERGKLQHLIWDNPALMSHRALAAIFGVILKLPKVKQSIANKQLGSRYLDFLIKRRSERLNRELQWL